MSDPSRETARVQFLLTILGLLLIFTLILLLALVVYPYVFAPPNTIATAQAGNLQPTRSTTPSPSPSLTPSPTRTLRDTFTPTISLTPTQTLTPTLTPTPTGPPTLTPARPVIGENNYLLQEWTPERADHMVALMQDYPNTLPTQSRGLQDENYYAAFEFSVTTQMEALLRFPDASQAEAWGWGLAYSLARLGDPLAGEQYARLIEQALNQGQVEVAGLQAWMQPRAPLLEISVHETSPIPGYLSAYVIEAGGQGSAFILLRETLGAFQTTALTSDFDFVKQPQYDILIGDLTGDDISEVAIIRQTFPGEFILPTPRVFDLAQESPTELPFHPRTSGFNIGTDFSDQWQLIEGGQAGNSLKFTSQIFPTCPVTISQTYSWEGSWFVSGNPDYQVEPVMDTLTYCRYVIDHAINLWGPEGTLKLMERILPLWPPISDENGNPFPADESDSWRFRLSIYQALSGNVEAAKRYLEEIIHQPTAPTSHWVGPAEQFLAYIRLENGLYRACVASAACQPAQALQYLMKQSLPGELPTILAKLWQLGVSQRSSGYFDFDGDGSMETWLTIRHRPGERLELWILVPYKNGIKAFNLGFVDANLPQISYYDESSTPPVIYVTGFKAFQVNRLPDSLEPYLTYVELPQFYPDRFKDELEIQVEALFDGVNPAQVKQALLYLQENPGLICRGTWSCDRYYYMLGLSAELAGDSSTAIDTYLRLWWDYSRSPYTTMARLKLKGAFVLPTATASFTPASTLTPALSTTPTMTGTPPTSTSIPYPSPSIGPTVTSAYPYP